MNREKLAHTAQNILLASKGQGSVLPVKIQQICATYAKIKAEMRTKLLPVTGAYCGTRVVMSSGSLECVAEPNTGVLVFCSATRPGGGWLTGATAQEESISRASTWALSCDNPQFYKKIDNNYFYKNAVLSVAGKIFEQNRHFLDKPILTQFVGMCAPNMRAMKEANIAIDKQKIINAMVLRMRLSLQAFADAGCTTVVLGAVGCGVFQVPLDYCTEAWQKALSLDGAPFNTVIFALGPNPSPDMQRAFKGPQRLTSLF